MCVFRRNNIINQITIKPEISILIVSYNARQLIYDCLCSLEKQKTSRNFEIILIDSSNDGTGEFVESTFQQVKVHRFEDRKWPGDARNIGISLANGDIVACIDADCRAEENWLEEIAKAHESNCAVIGGAIANATPSNYVGWSAYFCEFSHWMPDTPPQLISDMAGANISYKKEIFHCYGKFIEGVYCSDTEFHWRLDSETHRLKFEPGIVVAHYSINRLKQYFTHEFFHGRSFGRMRVKAKKFSRWKRILFLYGFPLIPLRILGKVMLNNAKNRIYLPQFLTTLPLIILGIICWSIGEVFAYAGK